MIGMLTGLCRMAGSGEAIIEVGGVGYLLSCGRRTLERMAEGEAITVHVETHVRENAITLYGFASDEERAWFVRLQSVQGVGPKAALAILDILPPDAVLSAANLGDKTAFARASGVGPKLAARIATELSGKAPPQGRGFYAQLNAASTGPAMDKTGQSAQADQAATTITIHQDAVSALVNLGINPSEAARCVAAAHQGFETPPSVDALIKTALKEIGAGS